MTANATPSAGDPSPDQLARWREGLIAATGRLAAVATNAPDVTVPTCPGWTVARLTIHTGRIHRWVADALAAPDGVEVPAAPRPDADADLGAWLTDGCTIVLDALDVAGPDGRVRAPGWDQPATWWRRRLCHETTVHAWDAQAAVGAPDPVPASLAIDGIDEVVEVLLPGAFDPRALGLDASGSGVTLHLHATDPPDTGSPGTAGGEWLIAIDALGVRTERRHAKGDVALRASASDLLLWVWGRLPTTALETFGDAGVAERFLAATRY